MNQPARYDVSSSHAMVLHGLAAALRAGRWRVEVEPAGATGRPDVLAEDPEGRKVVFEVKVGRGRGHLGGLAQLEAYRSMLAQREGRAPEGVLLLVGEGREGATELDTAADAVGVTVLRLAEEEVTPEGIDRLIRREFAGSSGRTRAPDGLAYTSKDVYSFEREPWAAERFRYEAERFRSLPLRAGGAFFAAQAVFAVSILAALIVDGTRSIQVLAGIGLLVSTLGFLFFSRVEGLLLLFDSVEKHRVRRRGSED